MQKQTIKDFKYVVKLGRMTNSFYDAESKGCNLFRSNPYYAFNHEPTQAIRNGVKGGRLVDLKGNITELAVAEFMSVGPSAEMEEMKKKYEGQIASLTKELGEANAQIIALTEELEGAKAKATDKAKGKQKEKASDEE